MVSAGGVGQNAALQTDSPASRRRTVYVLPYITRSAPIWQAPIRRHVWEMAKRPKKPEQPKKPEKKKRTARKPPPRPSASAPVDVEVLRALGFLSAGEWSQFADLKRPPPEIRNWLRQADVQEVRGLLIAALARWRELQRPDG